MMTFWIIVTIIAIVLELITPTALVTIWFSIGSLVALLFEYMGFSVGIQVFVFIVVSILSVIVLRPIATRYLRGNVVATNADRLINETCTVSKDITNETWGEVKIKGIVWSAVSIDNVFIPVGKKVKIMAIEGAKVIVREVEQY